MTRRIHCQTYQQLAALRAVLKQLGKKLAPKPSTKPIWVTVQCKEKEEAPR